MARVLLILALVLGGVPAAADDPPDLNPLIGARFDPAIMLVDETGGEHGFADLLEGRGTLLVLGYHRCENLCGIVQQQLVETLQGLPKGRAPGVLFASLDPGEGPADARAMRAMLRDAVPAADLSGWRFLTGKAPALDALARPMGMETYVRPGGEVIVHPAAVAVLTPGGALSEVFYGFDFGAAELERSLARAANGHVGGLRERIVLLCSGLDEAVGRVARNAWTGIRVLVVATVLTLPAALFFLWRREAR